MATVWNGTTADQIRSGMPMLYLGACSLGLGVELREVGGELRTRQYRTVCCRPNSDRFSAKTLTRTRRTGLTPPRLILGK